MSPSLVAELKRELAARGYRPDGEAPNGSMALDAGYLAAVDVDELFDALIARREKVFRSAPVVGRESAREAYLDVVAAVDAIKAVVCRRTLP